MPGATRTGGCTCGKVRYQVDGAPTGLTPQYELWIGRRENGFTPLPDARQFAHDRE